ncbi:DNA topoisomerase IV subunit A [Macrococcoides caseolyticum]|uniref:DNA topoisomerase 4 subunit A n=1 Tax=Macrococcus caseolyticus (strain JCSC5402) TaxID=458233 RepID=B9EBV8_MACCJ|nr:DNA topoisomerase IV subunit A [Macrococcus caseolyticus]BAH17719.1 topoisomerase IV subunit A [Macrococcus caseolyticus JCSC5402]
MNENIQSLPLEDVIGDRFGRYSKYIIQDRAIPDVRDGLKPVQRRILFAMYAEGNTYDKNYRKSAKTVGNVIGNYHPHGDTSVYDAMVRMSQDWKLRHVLVEMHGNNGSIDNDPPAAMRYTEAKLSKLANILLEDINKETVDFVQNFDDTAMEPMVLPANYPNLLVNGSTGISAGYATDIPPHNLDEVINATLKVIDKPNISTDEIMKVLPGPDFPTGGIIMGKSGIKQAYETGRGKIQVRGKVDIEKLRGGREEIIISEIPFEVNKSNLVKRIDELRADKKVDGIIEVRDETDRNGLRIAIELKKDANSEGILNFLYKNTDLQIAYNFNMVAISDRRPKLLGVRDMLNSFISHQKEVVTRRSQYDYDHAEKRMHIVEGLMKALSILDQVIKVIRNSSNKADAKHNLIHKFNFTEAQAEAIVMLQLYRLTNTDIVALEAEHEALKDRLKQLSLILNDETHLKKVIKKELKAIQKEFKEERLSQIEEKIAEIKISKEILVPNEETVISITREGYIKRTSPRSFNASGVTDIGMKEDDQLLAYHESNLQHITLVFTDKGRYMYIPNHQLPEIRWKDLGTHISQIVPIDSDERVIHMITVTDFNSEVKILAATRNGMIKLSSLKDFEVTRYSRPLINMKLKGNDVVNTIHVVTGSEHILVVTKQGMSLHYSLTELNDTGLKAAGVKSINLKDDDVVITTEIIYPESSLLIATQRGAMKKMDIQLFEEAKRAQRGLMILKELKSNPHHIIGAYIITEDMAYTLVSEHHEKHGKTKAIRKTDRYTNGSFIIDEKDFGKVVKLYINSVDL